LALSREARCDVEPGEPHLSGDAVDHDVGGLDALVEAALVKRAQGSGDADGQAQEAADLHGRTQQPLELFAAGILVNQHGSPGVADEL
jgi:hypothetical protein